MKREKVKQVEEQALEAHEKARLLRAQLQLDCKHEEIIEASYTPETLAAFAKPSFRVCTYCGFAEEGWRCGHQILIANPKYINVPREEAFKLKVGPIHENSQFVGFYLDVQAVGGKEAYKKQALIKALGLEKDLQERSS